MWKIESHAPALLNLFNLLQNNIEMLGKNQILSLIPNSIH